MIAPQTAQFRGTFAWIRQKSKGEEGSEGGIADLIDFAIKPVEELEGESDTKAEQDFEGYDRGYDIVSEEASDTGPEEASNIGPEPKA